MKKTSIAICFIIFLAGMTGCQSGLWRPWQRNNTATTSVMTVPVVVEDVPVCSADSCDPGCTSSVNRTPITTVPSLSNTQADAPAPQPIPGQ